MSLIGDASKIYTFHTGKKKKKKDLRNNFRSFILVLLYFNGDIFVRCLVLVKISLVFAYQMSFLLQENKNSLCGDHNQDF